MHKLLVLIWPLIAIIGVLYVILFDQGRGLDSPGLWLIPIGVLGIVATSIKNGNASRLRPLVLTWVLAMLSILGLYYGWFAEEYNGLMWIFPAAGFTLAGIFLVCVEATKNFKQ